jgi:CPA2 family monovalent cation:H+ antiporter-2
VLIEHPAKVLAVAAIIMAGTPAAAIAIVLLFRYPIETALTVGASLAQIGEFNFILAGLGVSLQLLPAEAHSLVLAGALISISLNPLVFAAVGPAARWLNARPRIVRFFARSDDELSVLPAGVPREALSGQVVLVGYGRVGRRIAQAMDEHSIAYVVAEQNREAVEALRKRGKAAVAGDASDPGVLAQAHVAQAAMLIVAAPDTAGVQKIVQAAREMNPAIEVVVRTHSDEETSLLEKRNVGKVFMGEHELARAMTSHVLERYRRASS